MLDLADVEPQASGDLIPDGTFAKVMMQLRRGGVDGPSEIDKGLLKASTAPGSDVLSLDAEFTVVEGRHARRKFWQLLTVSGGKLDEQGQSIGWNITKRTLRAMIDSALGLDPDDNSDQAKAKRRLRGLADLDGITFVARISVEPSRDPRYGDQNRLDHPVLPNEPEWRAVMDGKEVPHKPTRTRGAAAPAATQPAWAPQVAATAPAAAPAWGGQARPATPAAAPAAAPPAPRPAPGKPAGPAWLNS
jgi:hypothetical protein